MSDPVTVKIREESPANFEWDIYIGDFPGFPVPMGESGFASRAEALADALDTLQMLQEALEVGVRDEDGNPLAPFD